MGTERFHVNGVFMELTVSFGDRLRAERERLRLNQTAFAAIGGVTKKTQMLYEGGDRFPDARYLAAISEIGGDVRFLITGSRDGEPPETLSTDERELLALFRAAPLTVKAAAIGALQGGAGAAGVSVTGNNNRTAGRNYSEKK